MSVQSLEIAEDRSTEAETSPPARGRTLPPLEFVEEVATTREGCALLQRLFAYRKRLADANPLWLTQLFPISQLETAAESDDVRAYTIFVAAGHDPKTWHHRFPDLFVDASVRSRFGVEGKAVVV